jgi:hypothetical protein
LEKEFLMGLTTSPNGYRYPVGSDTASGLAVYFKDLADDAQANNNVFSTTEPPKKPGLAWYNPTDGTTQITDGTSWFYVMGPNVATVTTAATAASGVTTISTQQFYKHNGIVYLRVNMVLLAALAAGNIGNTTLCTVTDSRFTPLPDFTSYALASADNGDMASGVITPAGLIQVCATVRAFAIGDNISFGGSYPAAN